MLIAIAATLLLAFPQWMLQTSGTTARLRGVSAVNDRVAWASGANSTVLRTEDAGATWKKLTVTSDKLDFRDIDAINARTAYLLAIGNGDASRIYKTTDAGATWTLQFRNTDPQAFYDAMSFWDATHGIVIGDSIAGQFCILITEDGGAHLETNSQRGLTGSAAKRRRFCRKRNKRRGVGEFTCMDCHGRCGEVAHSSNVGSRPYLADCGRAIEGGFLCRHLLNRLSR